MIPHLDRLFPTGYPLLVDDMVIKAALEYYQGHLYLAFLSTEDQDTRARLSRCTSLLKEIHANEDAMQESWTPYMRDLPVVCDALTFYAKEMLRVGMEASSLCGTLRMLKSNGEAQA